MDYNFRTVIQEMGSSEESATFVFDRTLPGVLTMAILGLVVGSAPVTLAQGGPSVAPAFSNEILSTLDLPGIELTQSEDGTIEGLPDELVAGTYLVTIASDGDFATYVNFVQPPAGLSPEEAGRGWTKLT